MLREEASCPTHCMVISKITRLEFKFLMIIRVRSGSAMSRAFPRVGPKFFGRPFVV
ncbi:hypothetical protein LguiB_015392 [Lonicera macranthoides]